MKKKCSKDGSKGIFYMEDRMDSRGPKLTARPSGKISWIWWDGKAKVRWR